MDAAKNANVDAIISMYILLLSSYMLLLIVAHSVCRYPPIPGVVVYERTCSKPLKEIFLLLFVMFDLSFFLFNNKAKENIFFIAHLHIFLLDFELLLLLGLLPILHSIGIYT